MVWARWRWRRDAGRWKVRIPKVKDGRWKAEVRRWKMEYGIWNMEDGRWKMEDEKQEDGR